MSVRAQRGCSGQDGGVVQARPEAGPVGPAEPRLLRAPLPGQTGSPGHEDPVVRPEDGAVHGRPEGGEHLAPDRQRDARRHGQIPVLRTQARLPLDRRTRRRVKMFCSILLLIILTSCVSGTFVVNVTQTSYQAEENHDITLEWTFTTNPPSSSNSLNIFCELLTELKNPVLFRLHEGVEVPESQHEQFAGRVQWDKDVLRDGRLRLHVSRLRTEDSGLYVCDVHTDYGSNSGGCRLNVTGPNDGTGVNGGRLFLSVPILGVFGCVVLILGVGVGAYLLKLRHQPQTVSQDDDFV
ncbi:uncharacterized protein LOC144513263 isoform X2 [Sander vitreus]